MERILNRFAIQNPPVRRYPNKMKKIGTTSSGSVIVEMTSEQYEALTKIQAPQKIEIKEKIEKNDTNQMTLKEKVEFVEARIGKLKPKKKDGVIRSISAMFQFTGGVTDQEIQKVISELQKREYLKIDANSKVTYKEG